MEGNGFCKGHSGFEARIKNLETSQQEQWDAMEKHTDRINSIFTRLNIVLGSVVVACILMAINLVIGK